MAATQSQRLSSTSESILRRAAQYETPTLKERRVRPAVRRRSGETQALSRSEAADYCGPSIRSSGGGTELGVESGP